MNKETEIEKKFWKHLAHDRVVMLGLTGADESHAQPMSGQFLHDNDERGPIWFFTASDTDLVRALGTSHKATIQFVAKGHEIFATIQGELILDNNRATIDQLWNKFVAAWFEGGKDDPKLTLIRFEPAQGQFWLNENTMLAGVKLLLGRDPKQDYADKSAELDLRH